MADYNTSYSVTPIVRTDVAVMARSAHGAHQGQDNLFASPDFDMRIPWLNALRSSSEIPPGNAHPTFWYNYR